MKSHLLNNIFFVTIGRESILSLIMILLFFSCARIEMSKKSTETKDEKLFQIYSLWKEKATEDDIEKYFGKESKIVLKGDRKQVLFAREAIFPRMVFEINVNNHQIMAAYYAPEKLSTNILKQTIPCQEWNEKIETIEKKDLIKKVINLSCINEKIYAELENDGNQVKELWLGGGV